MASHHIPVSPTATIDFDSTEALLSAVEKLGYVVIDRAELLDHYADLREEHEGRGAHRNAADKAINYLFEALGEPGAGE